MVRTLGHVVLAHPLEGLGPKSAMQVASCIYVANPCKKLDAKARVSFPGWQCSMHTVTCRCWEKKTVCITPLGEDN